MQNRMILTYITTFLLTGFLLTCSLVAAIDKVSMPVIGGRMVWLTVFPQGWNFFTRDARESRLLLFRLEKGVWTRIDMPHGSVKALLGILRSPRSQGVELGAILSKSARTKWMKCTDSPHVCLERKPTVFKTIKNPSTAPLLCGTLGIVSQPPVPWAWSGHRDAVVMPSEILTLEVKCTNQL
jgi:antimicrobial peptide system SdpA family protein